VSITELADKMEPETRKLWEFIGERLLVGQEHYGGFNFQKYELDKMALEELLDLVVYRAAKKYLGG
jgi:hypothetical protein